MKKKILIVEDSPEYVQIIKTGLYKKYDLVVAEDGASALKSLSEERVDLVLLDVMLPDMHGHQICGFIRSQPDLQKIPVVFITGQDQLDEKLAGFEHGADDYLTKPFHLKELIARVAANLRKYEFAEHGFVKIGNLTLDTKKQTVTLQGQPVSVELTRIEFKLLVCFAQYPEWVITREQLLERVWPHKLNVSDRTIDSHISNLRKKIKGSSVNIKAVHGSGYRLRLKENKAAA